MDLREYERVKFELAALLRTAGAHFPAQITDQSDRLRELFVRLAEDRFNFVVVGRFNRGKSSLMNALLGTDRLPTGILPLTSVITTVTYGSKEQLIIHYEGRRLPSEVSIDELAQYVTQRENPGNARQVNTAEVQLPAEMLRRGFYFIDTPGLGSAIQENTETTERFLPEADAFVLVTSYESPLSEEELRVLRTASTSTRRVFVVLNKHDTVSAQERDEALLYVRQQLSALPAEHPPMVFSASARDALDANRTHDTARLQGSGIPALETELLRFLLEDKSTEFLLRMCDRVMDLVKTMPGAADVARLAEQVNALSQRIRGAQPGASGRDAHSLAHPAPHGGLHELRSCEVCARVLQATFDFLARYQYDLAVNPEVQQRHAEQGGFCPLHTWQYAALASPHGICTGYPALLERLAGRLREIAAVPGRSSLRSAFHTLLPTENSCLLCTVRIKAEEEATAALADRLRDDSQQALQSSSVLCLPHLQLLAAAVDNADARQRLLDREAIVLDRLAEDMRRFATKHDALRRFLASDEETHAYERALTALAGRRNVHRVATGS